MIARERLVDLEYAAAWRLVRALPERPALWTFETGAAVAARRGGQGVERLRAHYARVVPAASTAELDALTIAGMRSYGRYWCEAFRLSTTDKQRIHDATALDGAGAGALRAAIAEARPVVIALPHSGNWDAAGVWLVEELRAAGREPAFTTVAQRLTPESLYRRFVAYRESLGMEVVASDDGSVAHRALTRRLRGGGVVCLVADRDVTGGGSPVSFFGGVARMPRGPARLAALTGAMLLPICATFRPGGWGITFAEPVPVPDRAAVPAASQCLADAMASMIARAPSDWHALQPIWDPDTDPVPA